MQGHLALMLSVTMFQQSVHTKSTCTLQILFYLYLTSDSSNCAGKHTGNMFTDTYIYIVT